MEYDLLTVDTLLENEEIWYLPKFDRYLLTDEIQKWLDANAGVRIYRKYDANLTKIESFLCRQCWGFLDSSRS